MHERQRGDPRGPRFPRLASAAHAYIDERPTVSIYAFPSADLHVRAKEEEETKDEKSTCELRESEDLFLRVI